jgi:hypothetical protein
LSNSPDENVNVAFPVASVVTLALLNTPESAESVATAPEITALPEPRAVTVTVVEVVLSEVTVEGDADIYSVATLAVGVAAAPAAGTSAPVFPDPHPPTNMTANAKKKPPNHRYNPLILTQTSSGTFAGPRPCVSEYGGKW